MIETKTVQIVDLVKPRIMSHITKSKAVSEEYKSALADLTFNSKPLINVLTMLAEENIEFAQVIVQVICDRILKVAVDQKMPALYLLDSILKNIGGDYVGIISKSIFEVFCHTFESANDERKRMQLFKLRNTWTQYIPAKNLYDLDVRVSRTDPNWPVVAPPSVTSNLSPKVHINPKFLQKNENSISLASSSGSDVAVNSNVSKQQKLLEEEKRVQEQLKMIQAEKLKRDREQHELELRRQQIEREKLLAEQKRQLELLRQQQQNLLRNNSNKSNNETVKTKIPEETSPEVVSSQLSVNVSSRDPRLLRHGGDNSSTSETSSKASAISPKSTGKSALSVVNKIMTSVKKTKPSFVSSGDSPRITSFQETHAKREQRNKMHNEKSKSIKQEEDVLLLKPVEVKKTNIVSETWKPDQPTAASKEQQKDVHKEKESVSTANHPVSAAPDAIATTTHVPVPSVTNIIASVHNAVSIQAAALASAGPPPLPPSIPNSSYSQLTSRDMQLAAQVAAIATVMTQMQSGVPVSGMASQQSAELAAKLLQLYTPPTTSPQPVTTQSDTSSSKSENSEHDLPKESTKEKETTAKPNEKKSDESRPNETRPNDNRNSESRAESRSEELKPEKRRLKEDSKWRIEKEGNVKAVSRDISRSSNRKSAERDQQQDDDGPPVKKSRDGNIQDKSRKARARSPSRYHFRMEEKIETEKRVESKEHEMREQRIRKNSEGDESEYRPSASKRIFQSSDELGLSRRDRKKEFRLMKNKLLDIQRDQRERHPSFNISIVKDIRGEMNQKLKRGELTKQQYYELYEIVDLMQEWHSQDKKLAPNFDSHHRDDFRNPQPNQPSWRHDFPSDQPPNWDRHLRRDGPPFPRSRFPFPRQRPPFPREGPPLPRERVLPRERGPHFLGPQRQFVPPDMQQHPHFQRRSPNPPLIDDSVPTRMRNGPPGPPAMIGDDRDGHFFRGEAPRPRMPPNHTRPPYLDHPRHIHPQEGALRQPPPNLPEHEKSFNPNYMPHPQPRRLHPDGMPSEMMNPPTDVRLDPFYERTRNTEQNLEKMPPGFVDQRLANTLAGLLPETKKDGASENPVDVSGLLGKLIAAGILEKEKDIAVPELSFNLDTLRKRYNGAVNQIFQGMQCSSCGHRFPELSKVQYGEHLDWHFRQNRREKDGLNKVSSRAWYFDAKDWIVQTDVIRDDKGKVQSAFFEAERKQNAEVMKETNDKLKVEEESTIPVLGGEKDGVCDLCLEELEQYWDEEKEEWRYRKAVRENDRTFHQSCFEGYVPFELEETLTTPTTTPSPIFSPQVSFTEPSLTPDELSFASKPEDNSNIKLEEEDSSVDVKQIKTEETDSSDVVAMESDDTKPDGDASEMKKSSIEETRESTDIKQEVDSHHVEPHNIIQDDIVMENSDGETKEEVSIKSEDVCAVVKEEIIEEMSTCPNVTEDDDAVMDDEKDKGGDSPVYPPIITSVSRDDIKVSDVAMETNVAKENINLENIVKQELTVNENEINISVSEADKTTI